jgi:hypothetical protein
MQMQNKLECLSYLFEYLEIRSVSTLSELKIVPSLTLLVSTKLGMKIYHRQQGSLERLEKALKRLECPSKLVKRCHNKAGKGLRHVERLDGKAVCLSNRS